MNNVLMLIDMSMMLYRAAFANPHLKHKGFHTGAIFGCIQQITTAMLAVKPTMVIPCYDCPPYIRSKEFSGYKKGRSKAQVGYVNIKDMVEKSSNDMVDAFGHLGFPHYSLEGFEADDLIAFFAYDRHLDHNKIVIVSVDSDLYQLLELFNVSIWNSKKGFYDRADFMRAHDNVDPAKWPDVLAMTGTHNGVEGIRGIGIKTACKIVRDGSDRKWERILMEHRDIIDRNVELIDLPHAKIYHGDNMKYLSNPVMEKPNRNAFVRWVDMFGIQFTKRMDTMFDLLLGKYRRNF